MILSRSEYGRTKKKQTRAEVSCQEEDISVEELRAELVFLRLRHGEESKESEMESKGAEEEAETDAGLSSSGAAQTSCLDVPAPDDDPDSSSKVGTTNASRMSVTSTSSAGGLTQEITTTCVRDLMRGSRSAKSSMGGSTAFEEPTYTMLDVQREVLGLFADSPQCDSPAASEQQKGFDHHALASADASSSTDLAAASGLMLASYLPSGQSATPEQGSTFEVYQEAVLMADTGGSSLPHGTHGAGRELEQSVSDLPVWTDSEFDLKHPE